MKKFITLLLMTAVITGCATASIPVYLKPVKPFTERFYADHDQTLTAVRQTLKDLGWDVSQEMEPQVYETDATRFVERQTMLISDVRQTRFFWGTRYARLNVFIWSSYNISEVELRYAVTTDLFMMRWRSHGSKALARRFFRLLGPYLVKE